MAPGNTPLCWLQMNSLFCRRTLAICLTVLGCVSLAKSGPTQQRSYSVDRYAVNLKINLDRREVQGSETIDVRARAVSTSDLEFDCSEIIVGSASAGNMAQTFSQSDGHLFVHLSRELRAGQRRPLKFTFGGSPTKGLLFAVNQAFTVYHTNHWLIVDHTPGDLSQFEISINVPEAWSVISNGNNMGTVKDRGQLISKWREKRRVPDFVLGFAVGQFNEAKSHSGSVELHYFSAESNPDQLLQIFRGTPRALAFFSAHAGKAYPGKVYSEILTQGDPEQELSDFTLLPQSYGRLLLDHPDEQWLQAHELAHQWWGIGVACRDWSEFWLNEGIATFMADAFLGEVYGAARYDHEIEIAQNIYAELKASGKDHPLCYTSHTEADVGGRLPYFKGAFVLNLLRRQMGDAAFWRGLKKYTRDHWGETATSIDLELAMEGACRHSLRSFFDQWVYH